MYLEVPVADSLVSSIAASPFWDSVASEASVMFSPSGGSGALGSGFVAACLTASSASWGSAWTTCSAKTCQAEDLRMQSNVIHTAPNSMNTTSQEQQLRRVGAWPA